MTTEHTLTKNCPCCPIVEQIDPPREGTPEEYAAELGIDRIYDAPNPSGNGEGGS